MKDGSVGCEMRPSELLPFIDCSWVGQNKSIDNPGFLAYNSIWIFMLCVSWEGGGIMGYVADVIKRCLSYDDEMEWFEYKRGNAVSGVDEIGEYISALSNGAVMNGEPYGYLIWGVHNETHQMTGTDFKYTKDVDHEPFEHRLYRNVAPAIFCRFDEENVEGHRIVVLTIPAARVVPTSYKDERYIRIGSSKENIKKHPEREAALFRVLNFGPPDLLNTESRFSELSFDQLFLYYDMKGIKLNRKTFKTNLELLTKDGKYNMLAQLLSDDPHIPIRFAVFNGKDKTSTMYAVREYGNMCLLMSLDKVLDFGDTLNVPQADERERKVERKEVMLFSKQAFTEAVINAFAHNHWVNGDSPMFTAYEDRIEIVSLGTLPPGQTKEGFFSGVSVPVNKKLSEILLQLHISEKSGRGVPRIVKEYGQGAFDFKDNAIAVTIPFNRLDLGDAPSDTPSVTPPDTPSVTPSELYRGVNETGRKILEYCIEPKGSREILEHLGLKDIKSLREQLKKLLDQGRIARTIPDKPNSRNQKYITIK